MDDRSLKFESITQLDTPIGFFSAYSGNKRMPFTATFNSMHPVHNVVDKNHEVIDSIAVETSYEIRIPITLLETGKEYRFCFNGIKETMWEFLGSGEDLEQYSSITDNWVVGIAAYDPNEKEKTRQDLQWVHKGFALVPDIYDETGFINYSAFPLKSYNGFRFKVYDCNFSYACFYASWIKIGKHPITEYEAALGNSMM